jgi:hypothetical protein
VWIIRGGEDGSLVDAFVDGGYTAVEFPDVPDGRSIDRYDVTERLKARGWTGPETRAEVFELFVHRIGIGDLVVMPDPARRDVVLGRIDGDYEFQAFIDPGQHRHRRAVEWLGRHGVDELPESARDVTRQRAVVAERTSPALVAHVESIERGEVNARGAAETATPSSSVVSRAPKAPRAPRAPKAAAAPKPTAPADRTCPGCWLQKAPNQFRDGSDLCTDCE